MIREMNKLQPVRRYPAHVGAQAPPINCGELHLVAPDCTGLMEGGRGPTACESWSNFDQIRLNQTKSNLKKYIFYFRSSIRVYVPFHLK